MPSCVMRLFTALVIAETCDLSAATDPARMVTVLPTECAYAQVSLMPWGPVQQLSIPAHNSALLLDSVRF